MTREEIIASLKQPIKQVTLEGYTEDGDSQVAFNVNSLGVFFGDDKSASFNLDMSNLHRSKRLKVDAENLETLTVEVGNLTIKLRLYIYIDSGEGTVSHHVNICSVYRNHVLLPYRKTKMYIVPYAGFTYSASNLR